LERDAFGTGGGPESELSLRSARFRKGREESWRRLEELLAKMDKKGLRALSAEESVDLPGLYQITLSSLSVARNMILDRNLLIYLEGLSFRAYLAVYGPRDTLWEIIKRFIVKDFPESARKLKFHILISFVILLSGFVSGFLVVHEDLNNITSIVPEPLLPVPISATKEYILENEIFQKWPGFKSTFLRLSDFLFQHNSRVAIFAFSTSFLIGLPTIGILFDNGRIIGAVVSLHNEKDLLIPYLAWLSIHGVTEILAILLASAAGLSIAQRIILPGNRSRLKALALYGKEAAGVMIGALMMLFIAAILEGGFRQLVSATSGRAIIAFATLLFWIYYLGYQGKEPHDS
jgi:uncharacterized membrane protein SpoIIM required for sporulation